MHVLVIVGLGWLVYRAGVDGAFMSDDRPNIDISQGRATPSGSRYLVFLSFALNHWIGGESAYGYHVLNTIVHVGNALLVYLLLTLIFQSPWLSGIKETTSRLTAFAGAALFLTHPVHADTVYLVSSRFASVATLFYLLAVCSYLKGRLATIGGKPGSLLYFIGTCIFTVAAMRSKEISFTLPIVIALCELTLFWGKTSKREIIGLLVLSLAFLIIPLGELDLMDQTGNFRGTASKSFQFAGLTRYSYFLTQLQVVTDYLLAMLFPVDLVWAPYHTVKQSPALHTVLSFGVLVALFAGALLAARTGVRRGKGPLVLIALGGLWFFVTISVESSVIPIVDLALLHRLYLPSVGIFLAVCGLVLLVVQRSRKAAWAVSIALPLLVSCSAYLAHERHAEFADHRALWQHSLSVNPEDPYAAFSVGASYWHSGECDEALPLLVLARDSDDGHFHARLAARGGAQLLDYLVQACSTGSGGFRHAPP